LVATFNVFVPVARLPDVTSPVLVAIPLALIAVPLALGRLRVLGCGIALAACACRAHRVASLAQLVAHGVDLAADSGNGSCFAGLHKLTAHLLGQLRELRRRAEQLRALLKQAASASGQSSMASECRESQSPLHLVQSAQDVPGR